MPENRDQTPWSAQGLRRQPRHRPYAPCKESAACCPRPAPGGPLIEVLREMIPVLLCWAAKPTTVLMGISGLRAGSLCLAWLPYRALHYWN